MTRLAAAFAVLLAGCSIAAAQSSSKDTWPNRPVTLVVPLAAGGGSDGLIRVVTPRLSEILGQSVIVENVGGAGGMIGASRVSKATPDGYQMLLGTSGTQATNQSIYAKPLYDAATDFTPVGLIFEVPQVLLVKKDLPVNNLKEFTAYAKANQGTMQFGSSGAGGTGHLGCLLLNTKLGVDVTHVPYRGGGPAMQDLVAGRIDYQCALANLAMPQIEGKNVKAIAVLTPERSPLMPNISSLGEQGLPDFDASAWNVIVLPKDTPRDIADKLHKAMFEALDTPAVRDRLNQMGATVVPKERRSSAYLQKWTEAEIAKWAETIKAAGIVPQ
ncbi:MAG: tripartite tricarboxylate transporter substrate binding protein [Pseudomonadota bacterium]